LRFVHAGSGQQGNSQVMGIVGSKSEDRNEDASLVPPAGMLGIEAVVAQLANVHDG